MTEIKPCPFCGSPKVRMDTSAGPYPYPRIICARCGVMLSLTWTTTIKNVADAWNRRPVA